MVDVGVPLCNYYIFTSRFTLHWAHRTTCAGMIYNESYDIPSHAKKKIMVAWIKKV